jgi:hypothetical protein
VIESPLRGLTNRLVCGTSLFRRALHICYLASILLIVAALWNWGAVEVREHGGEVLSLTIIGVFWLIVVLHLFPWLGLCIDDVIERHNPAAFAAVACATLAVANIYAAGNLGEGPSYWNNIFSAAVGTIGFLGLWILLELFGRPSVSIAEERNLASGIRFSGCMLAIGLILSRAIAGDWHSESATIHDAVRDGWPAAIITLAAIVFEHILRPSMRNPVRHWFRCGLLPALAYIGAAVAWVLHLGRWEGM